ncbi:MAG: oligosaccharide flippase family protein [Gammaproteobacteria bacterium]|nr:oligosaccharide flippase family protein [Gammaproteobacteria bacterium]
MTNSSKRLLRNLNWVVSANAVAGIANFLAIAWFARALGPTTMGDYAIVVTVIQLVTAFLSAGFDQAIIRMPHDLDITAAAGAATIAQSLLVVLGSAVVYLYFFIQTPAEAAVISGPAALVLAAMVVSLFSYLLAAPIAAEMDYRFLTVSRLASTGLGIGAGVVLATLDYGLYALAWRDACTGLVMLLLLRSRAVGPLPWRASSKGIRKLFHFAKGLWALNLTERLVLRLDYGVVAFLLGKEVLGTYFVVRGIVEGMLGFLVNPVQTVLFAHYCHTEHAAMARKATHRRVVFLYIAACVGAAAFAWVFGPKLLDWLVGSAYAEAGAMLPALVVYAGAILWFENEKVFAMSRLRHHRVVYARLFQIAILLILVFPAIYFYGIVGASIATATGGVALALTSTMLARTEGG